MRDRIDPLIHERAPWLENPNLIARAFKPVLDRMLSYDKTVSIGQTYVEQSGHFILEDMANRLAKRVSVSGLWNLPESGSAMIVANHPTGIADALMLHSVMLPIRQDAFYYANSDILRVLPQMSDVINPVEWRPEKRSRESLRATMNYTREAVQAGRIGVIFPSGRLAKRVGMKLMERPWMTSAAMIARKFSLPIIPVNIQARNSALFYMFDVMHPTLRDITLFYETLNKSNTEFRINIGSPIKSEDLPSTSEAATDVLFAETMALAEDQVKGGFPLLSRRERLAWTGRTELS